MIFKVKGLYILVQGLYLRGKKTLASFRIVKDICENSDGAYGFISSTETGQILNDEFFREAFY